MPRRTQSTTSIAPQPQSNLSDFAAIITFHVMRGDLPPAMLDPLLGRPVANGETLGAVADLIVKRLLDKTLRVEFARTYVRLTIQATEIQRGCQDRPGTDQLLKILLDTCPAGIAPDVKRAKIAKTLDVYQGPCCQRSPCVHACADAT